MWSMSQITASGRDVARPEYTLHVDEIGEDVPVLLIHPALGSWGALHEDGPSIPEAIAARGCRVIGFDLAGHGHSDPLPEFPDDFLERSVADAVAVLESCGIGAAAAAIGIGFGGVVALRLAALARRRVRCVVADSVPGILASTPTEPWPGLDATAHHGYDPTASWLRYAEELSGAGRLYPAGMRIDVPTLIIACGAESTAEAHRMYDFARNIGGAQVAWAPVECPPVCRTATPYFINELEMFLAAYA